MSGLFNSLKNLAGSSKQSAGDEGDMRFTTSPRGGANGWGEWLKAMKLVARLPAGVPPEFRKKLWLTLAEQHLKVKGVDWTKAEKSCFSEWKNPDDTELGVQIVKDLHRTGCSLFCGSEGRENQAVLKRVLLAYARWNKGVGYCQGFNMLAALILEVMDRSESDSLKVMIYLIEAVLPEGYFANNLRGLSVDMAVFRDLLKLRLPKLSAHLDKLQKGAAEGSVYEPPLTNVFTMQWFLTLFCNCLPHDTVLRVWDLAFLEGDAVLLTTALAIWENLQDRILKVETADEFYSVMGELARETLEAPPSTGEQLIASAAKFGPIPELPKLRDKHRYNITPWAHSVQSAAKKGLRLFYSEDEPDSSDEGDKLALTTAYGLQGGNSTRGRSALVAAGVFGHPDREKLALDISALKQQYEKLRERQRQAHIILAAACARQTHVPGGGPGSMSMNHLLLGKSAIVSNRGRRLGPPQGAIPPSRSAKTSKTPAKTSTKSPSETLSWTDENQKKKTSRRDSIKWKDIKQTSVQSDEYTTDPEEIGQPMSDSEINELMQSSIRPRGRSESSSYSECSESSTSTSLCDEPNRMSDFDSEPASGSGSENAPVFPDEELESNIGREVVENNESKSDTEGSLYKSDKEFGEYIQEFEDLLDRTNKMDIDRGLVCVLPDNDSKIDVKKYDSIDTSGIDEPGEDFKEEIKYEDLNVNIDTSQLSMATPSNTNFNLCDTSLDNTYKTYKQLDENDDTDRKMEQEKCTVDLKDLVSSNEATVSENTIIDYSPTETKTKLASSPNMKLDHTEPNVSDDKQISDPLDTRLKDISDYQIETKYQTLTTKFNETKNETLDSVLKHNTDVKLESVVPKDSQTKANISPKKKFNDYMDSIRGEQLRSYLNEFKRADLLTKSEIYSTESDKNELLLETQTPSVVDDSLISDDQEVASICDDTRNVDKEDTATVRTISSIEYRSTSGDRSVSSSLSSVSPILRYTPGIPDEKSTFISYKSPCRESDLPKEMDEDEKPIVLTIDKYFEHSPEFFGARKSWHFDISSDEDDDKYKNKRKNLTHKSKYISPVKSDPHKLYLFDLKKEDKIRDTPKQSTTTLDSQHKPIFEDSDIDLTFDNFNKKKTLSNTTPSPISSNTKSFLTLKSPETFKHKRISSLDSPLSVKYLTQTEFNESSVIIDDDSPNTASKQSEQGRGNVLEKTKSEELPRQIKSFSVLDEEIDDIRIGRRNSEKALKIIQENSNILHSILVNQVNKCHARETLPEESYPGSVEEVNNSTTLPDIPFIKNKRVRPLSSPRSTSFDDRLLKYSDLCKPLYSSISPDHETGKREDYDSMKSPSSAKSFYRNMETESTASEKRNMTQRPKSFESHILLDDTSDDEYKHISKRRELMFKSDSEENKTDRFGWENKGFEAKQRYSSIYKDESVIKTDGSLDMGDTSKSIFQYEYKYPDSKILSPVSLPKLKDDPEPARVSKYKLDPEISPVVEKNSSLTSATHFSGSKDLSGVAHVDLTLELDRFKKTSEDTSYKRNAYSDTLSACTASLRTPTSPLSSKDKNGIVKSPDKNYSPFPTRGTTRQPKEIGLRLGLYKDSLKSPSK